MWNFYSFPPKNESVDKWDMKENDEFCFAVFPWVVISVCLRIV